MSNDYWQTALTGRAGLVLVSGIGLLTYLDDEQYAFKHAMPSDVTRTEAAAWAHQRGLG